MYYLQITNLPKRFIFLYTVIFSCLIGGHSQNIQTKREMRGVWVATVANIDWPTKSGLKKNVQKKEIISILDHSKKLGFNAIFLQVRPACDAFYRSEHEPWSIFLNNQSSSPRYDPLKFWIKEAHNRGIELHAWINPYRASMNTKKALPDKHPAKRNPEWFVKYGDKLYFNPGVPESAIHINKVVKDIVCNYNIDGIHMDDYFYPYPIRGEEFPDSLEYEKYGAKAFDHIDDWRRHNVNETIKSLTETIKSTKPWVSFGISPFGVWRNNIDDPRGSNTKAGVTNYDDLYADILLWMENQWIDYVSPQLYWETTHSSANYTTLAHWWNKNSYNTPIYIGHGIYKVGSDNPDWQDPKQLPMQMAINEELSNIKGSIFFSYKHFKRDLIGFQDSLKTDFYRHSALTPIINKKNSLKPPQLNKVRVNQKNIKWSVKNKRKEPFKCLVEVFEEEKLKHNQICYGNKTQLPQMNTQNNLRISVYLIDAYNQIIDVKSINL